MGLNNEGAIAPFSMRKVAIPNSVFATTIFVVTEIMFFVALISAFLVIKSRFGAWAPPEGVVLPVATTAANTLVLFVSGAFLFFAGRQKKLNASIEQVASTYLKAIILGVVFVAVQGYEWTQLIAVGMTLRSDIFGSVFYMIIGLHGLHALSAIVAMIWQCLKIKRGQVKLEHIYAMQVYWFFIVAIWPVLYALIYFP